MVVSHYSLVLALALASLSNPSPIHPFPLPPLSSSLIFSNFLFCVPFITVLYVVAIGLNLFDFS